MGVPATQAGLSQAEPKVSALRASIPDAALLDKRLRELSKVICDHLGGGSEWFSRIGDDFYVDPEIVRAELQRRKTDAQITKRELVRSNKLRKEPAKGFNECFAQGTPTRSAETTGSVGEADGGPVAESDAPDTLPSITNNWEPDKYWQQLNTALQHQQGHE